VIPDLIQRPGIVSKALVAAFARMRFFSRLPAFLQMRPLVLLLLFVFGCLHLQGNRVGTKPEVADREEELAV
jgi:hypothetical protein